MLAHNETKQVPTHVVWRPIKGTSQYRAVYIPVNHILYTGSRGPGKTDVQLMRFRNRVGLGYGKFWRGVIFDRKYKNLDDLISKSERWFHAMQDGSRFLKSQSDYKWVWPTGEELLFRHIEKESDYWNYHGQEFPYIGWNELCKQATPKLYDMMMSCNRSSFTPEKDTPYEGRNITEREDGSQIITYDRKMNKLLDPIPLETFSTTNSYGPGHAWVKQRFIDPAPYGDVIEIKSRVYHPAKKCEVDVIKTQVAVFGSYRENIYLSPEYVAELDRQPDPNMRKAWLTGTWDIVAGGALDDVWNKSVHVVERFQVPKSWRIDRAFDWGSTHPFSVGWFAMANGEEITFKDGRKFCPTPGSLIQVAEWYGADKFGQNRGLRMSATDIAQGIKEREKQLMADGWFLTQPKAGPADNQIRDVREIDVETIETKMAKEGIRWKESDKSPGSRRNGLQLIRDRLEASVKREGVGLYFTENCRASIACLPILPRDEDNLDDVDTTAEDHPYDMIRYRVLGKVTMFATPQDVRIKLPHA